MAWTIAGHLGLGMVSLCLALLHEHSHWDCFSIKIKNSKKPVGVSEGITYTKVSSQYKKMFPI